MQYRQLATEPPPDDGLQELLDSAATGELKAFELQPWPGVRILDSYSFRTPPRGTRRVDVIALGHGRKWSTEGWVGISTWQAWSAVAAAMPAVRRQSIAASLTLQARDWEIRGLASKTLVNNSFVETLSALGFESLGEFGPERSWVWEPGDGTVVVASAVGPLPEWAFALDTCLDLTPYVAGLREDLVRRTTS